MRQSWEALGTVTRSEHLITVSHVWKGFRGLCEILSQIVDAFVYVCECFSKQRGHNPGPREDAEVFLNGRSSLAAWLIYLAYQRAELLKKAL